MGRGTSKAGKTKNSRTSVFNSGSNAGLVGYIESGNGRIKRVYESIPEGWKTVTAQLLVPH